VLSEIFLQQGLDRLSVICPSCCFVAADDPTLSLPGRAKQSIGPLERFPLRKVYNRSKRMKEKRGVLNGAAAELRRIIAGPAESELRLVA
jgi:hypothetical protein